MSFYLSPLQLAAMEGNFDRVKYLISIGENIESITNGNFTPLFIASQYGHLNIVEYLISKGANLESKSLQNATPLHIAHTHI